jgi:hypothetical protein
MKKIRIEEFVYLFGTLLSPEEIKSVIQLNGNEGYVVVGILNI